MVLQDSWHQLTVANVQKTFKGFSRGLPGTSLKFELSSVIISCSYRVIWSKWCDHVATGVGKTSLATALAETWLGSRRALVRVDTWPWRIIAQRFSVLDMFPCVSLVLSSFHQVQSVSCKLSKMFEDEEFRTVQAQAVQSKQGVHLQQLWDVDHTQLCLGQVSDWSSLVSWYYIFASLCRSVLWGLGLAILCFMSTMDNLVHCPTDFATWINLLRL